MQKLRIEKYKNAKIQKCAQSRKYSVDNAAFENNVCKQQNLFLFL